MRDNYESSTNLGQSFASDVVAGFMGSRSMYWRPNYLTVSAWVEHLPFAFWIMEAHRPRTFVELGTHYGVSYFAFCQAVAQLACDTRCFAVDTWNGDEHAGFYDEKVFTRVQAHNEANFSSFSRLVRSTFDEALDHFSDGSIDLLHIDGHHTLESVRHDFESWLPKLSSRAIVLFHDTNVRERGFGVFQLIESLREDYPVFEFVHGHGLGVVAIGALQSEPIQRLLKADSNEHERRDIRDIFGRLGRACADTMQNMTLREQEAHLRQKTGELQKKIDELSASREKVASELTVRTHERDVFSQEIQKTQEESTRLNRQLEMTVTQTREAYVEAKDEIARLRSLLQEQLFELSKYRTETACSVRESEFLRVELNNGKQQLRELESENRALRDATYSANGLKYETERLKEDLKKSLSFQKELEIKMHNMREVAGQTEDLRAELDVVRSLLRDRENVILELREQINNNVVARFEADMLKDQIRKLEILLGETETENKALRFTVLENANAVASASKLKEELEATQTSLAQSENQLRQMRGESELERIDLEAKIANAQVALADLARREAERNSKVSLEIESLTERNRVLQSNVEDRFAEIATLTKGLFDEQARVNETVRRENEVRKRLTDTEAVVEKLSREASREASIVARRERRLRRRIALAKLTSSKTFFKWSRNRNFSRAQMQNALIEAGLFDANWYLEKNVDVKKSGMPPFDHYVSYGAKEERDLSPLFSTKEYLKHRPELRSGNVNPIFYYILSEDNDDIY